MCSTISRDYLTGLMNEFENRKFNLRISEYHIHIGEIANFYVDGKVGTINIFGSFIIPKHGESPIYEYRLGFRLTYNNYVDTCIRRGYNTAVISFVTYDELQNKMANRWCCFEHTNCRVASCPIGRIKSSLETCSICMTEKQLHEFERTKCNHSFCLPCLNRLCEGKHPLNSEAIACPMCRQNLKH